MRVLITIAIPTSILFGTFHTTQVATHIYSGLEPKHCGRANSSGKDLHMHRRLTAPMSLQRMDMKLYTRALTHFIVPLLTCAHVSFAHLFANSLCAALPFTWHHEDAKHSIQPRLEQPVRQASAVRFGLIPRRGIMLSYTAWPQSVVTPAAVRTGRVTCFFTLS